MKQVFLKDFDLTVKLVDPKIRLSTLVSLVGKVKNSIKQFQVFDFTSIIVSSGEILYGCPGSNVRIV